MSSKEYLFLFQVNQDSELCAAQINFEKPREIWKEGTDAVIRYFDDLANQ